MGHGGDTPVTVGSWWWSLGRPLPFVHPDGQNAMSKGFPTHAEAARAILADAAMVPGASLNIRAGYSTSNTSLNPIGQSPPRWTSNVSMKTWLPSNFPARPPGARNPLRAIHG